MNAIVLRGDARQLPLPDACVDLIVTSPPYFGLRSYTDGGEHYGGQIGSEPTPQEWVAALVECTAEWMRVLKPSGSMFVNLGDKYAAGHGGRSTMGAGENIRVRRDRPVSPRGGLAGPSKKTDAGRAVIVPGFRPKGLLGLPWRYALACTDQLGLILRRDIIWAKPNGLPESVTDRCRSSHEYLFHLVKQPRYYAAVDEIREPHTPASLRRYSYDDPDWTGSFISPGNDRSVTGKHRMANVAGNALGKLPGSVWSIPSQPLTVPPHLGVDHFAAFPMELPRRCVLGWSPPGICTSCGEGRRPVTDLSLADAPGGARHDRAHSVANHAEKPGGRRLARAIATRSVTGYACACPDDSAPVRPAIVLDPFGGTGTTALVAAMHGRTGVSIDRSGDYTRLARWRTQDPGERAKALQVPKPPPVPDGMEALF